MDKDYIKAVEKKLKLRGYSEEEIAIKLKEIINPGVESREEVNIPVALEEEVIEEEVPEEIEEEEVEVDAPIIEDEGLIDAIEAEKEEKVDTEVE